MKKIIFSIFLLTTYASVCGQVKIFGDARLNINSHKYYFLNGLDSIMVVKSDSVLFRKPTNISAGSSYTFANGLTEIAGTVKLGGTLSERTIITGAGFGTHFTDTVSSLRPYIQYLSASSPNFFESGTGKMLDSTSVFIGKGTSLNRVGVNDRSVYIGMEAGRSGTTGGYNIGIGYQALRDAQGVEFQTSIGYQSLMTIKSGIDNFAMGDLAFNTLDTSKLNVGIGSAVGERLGIRSDSNTLIGNYNSWYSRAGTNANVVVGLQAMSGNNGTTYVHNRNTIIGTQAARLMTANMTGNVLIGYRAGYNTSRSNALYIENSESETPLIEGDFAADSLRINGKLSIRDLDSTATSAQQNVLYASQEGKLIKAPAPLTASATLDFPNTASNTFNDLTMTLTGASDGDVVALGVPGAEVYTHTHYFAWVSSANTITIRFLNNHSGAHDPNSGTFKVRLWK